jgi:hypothetical protein
MVFLLFTCIVVFLFLFDPVLILTHSTLLTIGITAPPPDHVHPIGNDPSGAATTYTIPRSGHTFDESTGLRFDLIATSFDQLESVATVEIWPLFSTQRFESEPTGMKVMVDHLEYITPFDVTSVANFEHHVDVAVKEACVGKMVLIPHISGPHNSTTNITTIPESPAAVVITVVVDPTRQCINGTIHELPEKRSYCRRGSRTEKNQPHKCLSETIDFTLAPPTGRRQRRAASEAAAATGLTPNTTGGWWLQTQPAAVGAVVGLLMIIALAVGAVVLKRSVHTDVASVHVHPATTKAQTLQVPIPGVTRSRSRARLGKDYGGSRLVQRTSNNALMA